MLDIKYDPELPYAVLSRGEVKAHARYKDEAEVFANHYLEGYVIDTTPKPKIPEDAEFILVETEDVAKDIYQRVEDKHEDAGFYWYRVIDSMAYGHDEMPDMIGDAEVTVLVRKEET